jgi:hypoxanthine-DNA glycosylase
MPGEASLDAGQYYAHARNAYWKIMGELFGAGPELPYDARLQTLTACGIALWDVLESCIRPGSLDSSIDRTTAQTNDFAALFARHRSIRNVFFNGRAAEQLFRRRVLPDLGERAADLSLHVLPSTSPAHASRSYAQKLRAWTLVREALRAKR